MQQQAGAARRPPQAYFIDVDGVLLKAPYALQHVRQNAVVYAKRAIEARTQKSISLDEAYHANRVFYDHYGHTLLGLRAVVDPSLSLADFCAAVYNVSLMHTLKDTLLQNTLARAHAEGAARVLRTLKQLGHPLYLFSNAPHKWCYTIVKEYGLDDLFGDDRILTCDCAAYGTGGLLKPQPKTYVRALQVARAETPDIACAVVIDDSFMNLMPVVNHPEWHAIWFGEHTTGAMPTVGNMKRWTAEE